MERVQNISDVSKETLTFLAFFSNEMIDKIPAHIITKLCEQAADSNLDFYIDAKKTFEEQNISEKSKDLISLIYYDYIAEVNEKEEILKQWELNEQSYQNIQEEKYSYDNLFKRPEKTSSRVELTEVKEETILQKIKNLFKKLIK